jgi:PilZ domain
VVHLAVEKSGNNGSAAGRGEKRQWPRLLLKLNVEFSAEALQQERISGTGTTENVSAGGLYFRTTEWRDLHPGLDLQLHLSGLSGYDSGPLFRSLRGKATVLRLDMPEKQDNGYGKVGVAVRFDERPRVDVYRLSA